MSIDVERPRLWLCLVLLAATALRMWHIGFGLPSLNDPDEPLFVMKALDLLREGAINPGWFGHPATTLFYALAVLFALIAALGMALGAWASPAAFAAAVFADPGMIVLPGRVMIALVGIASVALVYCIGRRVAGARAGLVAAALLAVSPLHVELSQTIRTDVPATALMLLSSFYAVRVAQGGRLRDILLAGMAAGVACATKWPAALVLASVEAAVLMRVVDGRQRIAHLIVAPIVAVITLLLVSPFLILDYATVVHDLGGEARGFHLGATGAGWASNFVWYLVNPISTALGVAGLVLAAAGLTVSFRRDRTMALALFAAPVIFLIAISGQALIWERWAVPLLPYAALAAALGLDWVVKRFAGSRQNLMGTIIALLVCAPILVSCVMRTQERSIDTRQAASVWLRDHVDPGASVLIEHAGFDLLERPGRVLFPLGAQGCIDVRAALSGRPTFEATGEARGERPIIDIGNVDPGRLATCRADYAILSHYSRYAAEQARFPLPTCLYRALLRNGQIVASFAPETGRRGGPDVQVVRLAPQDFDAPASCIVEGRNATRAHELKARSQD